MDDIVDEAGLSKGAVYWYFKSKDEIIKSILDWFLRRELVEFQELLKQDSSVRDRFITMIHHLMTELEQYSKVMQIRVLHNLFGSLLCILNPNQLL